MGLQNPEQILIHRPADDVINLRLGVYHLSMIAGAGHKAVIKAVVLRLAGRLDLYAVKLAVPLGHQVVTCEILHRGQHTVPVAKKRTGHTGHADCTNLSGG